MDAQQRRRGEDLVGVFLVLLLAIAAAVLV